MLKRRFERLNALADINSASKYLEIGVSSGGTFIRVKVPQKIAVDPCFKDDVHKKYANENSIFYEITSDSFFSTLAPQHGEFDLIYLDGLHTFEQTFRDFCNSLRYSHSRTIWLIDDTYPISWVASISNYRLFCRLRKWIKIKDSRWMGDVYKVIFAIHDFFPQFSYATFPGHGQTVLWLETRKDFTPTWDSLEKISRLSYWDFEKFKDTHLLIRDPETILDQIKKSFA